MRVKFKAAWLKTYPMLTPGNTYRVIEVSGRHFRVMDDIGEPILFVRQAFEVVDGATPPDWVVTRDEDGELQASPAVFQRGFFEKWFDRDPETRAALSFYLAKLQWSESESTISQSRFVRALNSYVTYSEIDDDGWEIRKIIRFEDGKAAFADAKESVGTDLSKLDFETERLEDISSEDFERLWLELHQANE